MSFENIFATYLGSAPLRLGLAAVVGLVLFAAIVFRLRRQQKVEPPPRPRPISIETELQLDVKRRWKNRFKKQPGL